MATGSKGPVVSANKIGPDTITLALGIDELPSEYFNCLIHKGSPILIDSIDAVKKHGVDAIAYYYSWKAKKLMIEGKRDGIMNIADYLAHPPAHKSSGATHVATVGLASQDLAVAIAIFKSLVQCLYDLLTENLLPIPSPQENPSRIQHLQALMARDNLNCMICFGQENSFYLAHFNPTIYSNEVITILFKGQANPVLIVNTLRKEKAEAMPGHCVVCNYGKWFDVPTEGDTWDQVVQSIIGDNNMTIRYKDSIPMHTY